MRSHQSVKAESCIPSSQKPQQQLQQASASPPTTQPLSTDTGSIQQEHGSIQQEHGSIQLEHGSIQQEPGSIQQEPEFEEDYTLIPNELDRKFEILDEDSALRPTIIQPGQVWVKSSQVALLSFPVTQTLTIDQQQLEKNKAFDLLDALTRSGCLMIDQASLHVVMAATHCFDKTLIDTVIQDNVNPIEKVERSALIVATTIHNKPAHELVKPEQLERVSTYSPGLFEKSGSQEGKSLTISLQQSEEYVPLLGKKESVELIKKPKIKVKTKKT